MPTPVATAKQCLNPEATKALEEAVSIARCRNHAQTTSLHVVSAFLSLPSSPLREACLRLRNAAFCFYSSSPRAQIRALEFAISVSLDRSTSASSKSVGDPPVANSLMAAIKRSQSDQKRQPDGFGYKQEIGGSGVKVEIRNLIAAIFDDPSVGRVFTEAGYNSLDLKLDVVRPLPGFWRCSEQRQMMSPELRPFKFPFSGEVEEEDHFNRIGEVFCRRKGRNPLLFGVCGYDALNRFVEAVRTQDNFLPLEIRGKSFVSVEREILRSVSDEFGAELMRARFEELAAMVENCSGAGLIVCFGDLKAFVMEESDDFLSCLVAKFTSFLELYKDRVWLIGSASYETYMKFMYKFPSAEKDWNLQPLAITSTYQFPNGDKIFKSSLMKSFVPFAGLFPPSSDFGCASKSSYQLTISDKLCSAKPAQEATNGSRYDSVVDQCQTSLASFLSMDKTSMSNTSDTSKIPSVERNLNTEEDCQTLLVSAVATDLVLGISSHSHPTFKPLYEALITRISGQEEAMRIISQTISHTTRNRRDVWINFTGSNTFVMKKTAIALAEVICGNKNSLIHVDLNSQDGLAEQCAVLGNRKIRYSDKEIKEMTTFDQIACSLSKMDSSVVLLDNLHLAHHPTQNSLLNGIRTGIFLDSNRTKVCYGHAIFLLNSSLETSTSEAGSEGSRSMHKLKPWALQIEVGASSRLLTKRKLNSTYKPSKRLTHLDLNLPADENIEPRLKTWPEELLSLVDTTVIFKPFDYEARIQGCFSKSFCSACVLEIDPRAMDRLLRPKETEIDDFSENVLSKWFIEARKRYHHLVGHSVVKLGISKPLYMEEEEDGAFECLPSKAILHCMPLENWQM